MSFIATVVAIGEAAAGALALEGAAAAIVGGAITGAITGAVVSGTVAAVTGGNIGKGILQGGLIGGIGGGVIGGISNAVNAGATAAESTLPEVAEIGAEETGLDALGGSVSGGSLDTSLTESPKGLINSGNTAEPWSNAKTLAVGTGLSAVSGIGSGYMQAQGAKTAAENQREAQREADERLIASKKATAVNVSATPASTFTKAPPVAPITQVTGTAATPQTTGQASAPQTTATMSYRNLTPLTPAIPAPPVQGVTV
jgi:hypothetical protein